MHKKNYLFYLVAVLAVMLFFSFSAGGCGGGHGSLSSNSSPNNEQNNPTPEQEEPAPTRDVWDEKTAISLLNAVAGFDLDSNGKMDFLDFDDVAQLHLGDNTDAVELTEDASYKDGSEGKLSVPAMVWLKKLHPKNENPNIFQVYLEEGKRYTFEFSKNLTEPLFSNIPEIKIFDPENAAVPFYEASSLRPKITPIPDGNPSIICYTIKPEVSGYYLVVVSSQESTVEVYGDTELEEADSETEKINSDGVIFVYQEMGDEDKGEVGYFTKFTFTDINGDKTDAINIADIIQLRKLFLDVNPTYFDEMYGQNSEDDEFGDANNDLEFLFNNASQDLYLSYLDKVQTNLGLIDADELEAQENAIKDSRARVALIRTQNSGLLDNINEDNDDETDSADIALKDYYHNKLNYDDDSDTYSAPSYSINKVLASKTVAGSGVKASASSNRSDISANIAGIPYEPTYTLGSTYSGVTFASAVANAEGLEERLEEANKARTTQIPLQTKFWTELVTTREEAEKHSEISGGGGIGLAKQAAGSVTVSAGTSGNYKYGLTSMTLVIHFEVTETDYRRLTTKGYNDFAFDNRLHKKAKKMNPDRFRKEYGDYFVAGYQYGACYEASIAITTDTTEQLDEVKSGLNLSGSYNDVTVSADMKQKMTDSFKAANARVNVNVITTGFGDNAPTLTPLTASGDVSGDKAVANCLDQIFEKYNEFYKNVQTNKNRENFVPIRVYMMRWRSLSSIADQVLDKWEDDPDHHDECDGTIPIPPKQKTDADRMNAALANLRAYYNDSATARSFIPPEKKIEIDDEFNRIVGQVRSWGEEFYTVGNESGDRCETELPKITTLSTTCKNYQDRYVFYQKLVQAQKKELEVTQRLWRQISKWADDSGDDDRLKIVNQFPFGGKGSGNSGFESFPSSSVVQSDFEACEANPKKVFDTDLNKEWNCHKRVYIDMRKGGTTRLEWYKGQRTNSKNTQDWQPDVGDAYIEATAKDGSPAIFAFVKVESAATKAYEDRKRFIMGSGPNSEVYAVGTPNVSFQFMSSYGNSVNWTIQGIAVRFKPEDYPFNGLK